MSIKATPAYNLAVVNPVLAKQWHPARNGALKPKDVMPGSGKKVWWKCRKGHEWQATIISRKNGSGCPFCSNKAVNIDNCLQAVNPELAAEWHPTKNHPLTPRDVTPGSEKKIWWACKNGHEWRAWLYHRSKGSGCPYCSKQLPSKDTCLQAVNPALAKEWHPTRNHPLTASDVLPYTHKRVWWVCAKGHTRQATVRNRSLGSKCSYCNSLQTVNPALAKEWHCKKNRKLTPANVTVNSGKAVWWLCGKGHEWRAIIASRNRGSGCPFCSNKAVDVKNSLETVNPALAKEWHPTKNKSLTPQRVVRGSGKIVWWLCKKGHEWENSIVKRSFGQGCPYCSGRKACIDNCLQTINPALAKEWHPTKNESLRPTCVTPGSNRRVWWKCKMGHEWKAMVNTRSSGKGCPLCHPATSAAELRIFTELKSIFDNAIHRHKISGVECDIYIPDLNIAIEIDGNYWHKNKYAQDRRKVTFLEKNGIILIRLREEGLKKVSHRDVIFSDRAVDFNLIKKLLKILLREVSVNNKTKTRINTYLKNRILQNNKQFLKLLSMMPSPLPGRSLLDLNKRLAREWHPSKNYPLTPRDVTPGSDKRVWWLCKRSHAWQARVAGRTHGTACPYCSGWKK